MADDVCNLAELNCLRVTLDTFSGPSDYYRLDLLPAHLGKEPDPRFKPIRFTRTIAWDGRGAQDP